MIDRLLGGGDEPTTSEDDEEAPYDRCLLMQTSPEHGKVATYDAPVSREVARVEHELRAGTYKLQTIADGQWGDVLWTLDLGAPDPDSEEVDDAEEASASQHGPPEHGREPASHSAVPTSDFEDPFDVLRYEIVANVVQNEELMRHHGEDIVSAAVESAFGDGGPDVDYEIDSELGMFLHELRRDPQKAGEYVALAGELSEQLGQSFGQGMLSGMSQEGASGSTDETDDQVATALGEIAMPEPEETTDDPSTDTGTAATTEAVADTPTDTTPEERVEDLDTGSDWLEALEEEADEQREGDPEETPDEDRKVDNSEPGEVTEWHEIDADPEEVYEQPDLTERPDPEEVAEEL